MWNTEPIRIQALLYFGDHTDCFQLTFFSITYTVASKKYINVFEVERSYHFFGINGPQVQLLDDKLGLVLFLRN
jgi:hypothetical protein